MKLKKLAASAVIASMLAAAPAVAQSSASSLSLASAAPRAGASLQDESNIEGVGTGLLIIGAIVVGLAIWGIIELTSDDDPSSP